MTQGIEFVCVTASVTSPPGSRDPQVRCQSRGSIQSGGDWSDSLKDMRKRAGRTMLAACAIGVSLVSASMASGQSWGGRPMPRQGACFYQDINFRGQYFCVAAGEDLDAMPAGSNDRISSIRVLGRTEVTVYTDPRFRGQSLQFEVNAGDLQRESFNDLISSVQVRSTAFDGGGFRRGGQFGSQQNPDVIVRRAYQDILERDPDPAGLRTYRSRIIDDGWTEQQVRDALRASPEYREKTRAKAEEIVRRAYLSVLKREPDAGSAGYVNRVLRDNWTQADVERELRRSPEFRNQ
jgi:hypothetical protein